MCPRLSGHSLSGRDLHCCTIIGSSGRKQKYTSTQISSYVCKSIQERTKDRKINSKNFNSPVLTENYLESMEIRSTSSGTFSQNLRHWEYSKRLIQNILKGESASCQCSMIDWTKRRDISNSEQVKKLRRKDPAWTLVIPRPSRRKQWCRTHTYKPEGK